MPFREKRENDRLGDQMAFGLRVEIHTQQNFVRLVTYGGMVFGQTGDERRSSMHEHT